MNTQTRETDTTGRRLPGEAVDAETRGRLRAYVDAVHWRRAAEHLAVGPAVIRRALAGARIRTASARSIRVALRAMAEQEPQP